MLHLIDGTAEDVAGAYHTVRGELGAYGAGLGEKPEIVALSKVDALTPDAIKVQSAKLKAASGKAPLVLSSASGKGVQEVLRALASVIDEARGESNLTEYVSLPNPSP